AGTSPHRPMQLRLLEKQKDSVRIEILNADDTVIYPLITALLKDADVEDALYYTGHPQLDKPVLTVKVKKGSPQAVLKRVAENLATEFAGAKDKHAVTTRLFSFEGIPIDAVRELHLKDVEVLDAFCSDRPLEIGGLAGNRFHIVVKNLAVDEATAARSVAETERALRLIG